MAAPYRTATALLKLRAEVDARWPRRDRRSDGLVGDAAHALKNSDHNPWLKLAGVGVVRAFDLDKDLDGVETNDRPAREDDPIVWVAEFLRELARRGDPRLVGGGYLIFRRRIASERDNWAWRPYTGVNAHAHHLHVSVSRNASGFDSRASWGLEQEDSLTATETATLARIEGKLDEVLTQLYGPRPAGRIEGWPQLGGRTLVDGVAETLTRLDALPGKAATELLNREVGPVLTMRKGATTDERVRVENVLTRSAEASVVRQRDEAAAEVVTP